MSIEPETVEGLLQPLFRKIMLRDHLGIEEQRAITEAADQRWDFSAGQDLVSEGT